MSKLLPTQWYESTYKIDFDNWYERGIRGIIFDVDNTLVPHGAPADQRSQFLIQKLKDRGFKLCMISNNKEPRVKMFCDVVKTPYVYKAGKPRRKNYLKAMEIMETTIDNTLFVGDQLFTDVWGANRTGIPSILVTPMDPHEEIQIVLKRKLERIILYFYKKRLKK